MAYLSPGLQANAKEKLNQFLLHVTELIAVNNTSPETQEYALHTLAH